MSCVNEDPCEDVIQLPPITSTLPPVPAVPVGYEGKYGNAGLTLEPCEIHPDSLDCASVEIGEAVAIVGGPEPILAYTGSDTGPNALAGFGLLMAGCLLLIGASRANRMRYPTLSGRAPARKR
jgi:hypothetical protein